MSEISNVIKDIISTMEPTGLTWVEFTIAIQLSDEGIPCNHYGYAYSESSEPIAIVADDFVFEKPLLSYFQHEYGSKPYPIKLLIQFNRNSGRYHVEFEDKDPTRWQVTPANIDTIREALRPNLG